MSEEPFPTLIYQFRSANIQTLENILVDKIYFNSPDQFNDPYETYANFINDLDLNRLEDLFIQLITKRITREYGNSFDYPIKPGESHSNYVTRRLRLEAYRTLDNVKHNATNQELNIEPNEYIVRTIENYIYIEVMQYFNIGISCFTSNSTNQLMWSHYADSHRGFCLAYSTERNPAPKLNKVIYEEKPPITTTQINDALVQHDQLEKTKIKNSLFSYKTSEWNYEQELRLFSKVGIQDSPLRLKKVILGLHCPLVTEFILLKMFHNHPRVRLSKMRLDNKSKLQEDFDFNDGEILSSFPIEAQSPLEIFPELEED